MKKVSVAAFLTVIVLGFLAAYRYGMSVAQQGVDGALSEVQLILAFNHMQQYQDIHHCLELGKSQEAQERLAHAVVTQKELVAELLLSTDSPRALDYIAKRAEEPLEALRNYKSQRGSSWSVPACQ